MFIIGIAMFFLINHLLQYLINVGSHLDPFGGAMHQNLHYAVEVIF